MINNLFLMENLVFRTKSNFLKRLYGSRLLNSTLERPRLYHSVCILNVYVLIFLPLRLSFHILFILLDCWNVRNKFYLKGCLDFNKNTEVSISQNYFNLHFNLGPLRKPRKHNFRVRIYQKGDLTFILSAKIHFRCLFWNGFSSQLYR